MNQASTKTVLRGFWPRPSGAWLKSLMEAFILCLFFLDLVSVSAGVLRPGPGSSWLPESAVLILAVAVTLISLWKELPAQNIVLVVAVIGALSLGADLLATALSVPSPARRTEQASVLMLVWWMPLIRVFAILNARSVARSLLAARRQAPDYGLWVLGGTVLLATVFGANLAVFARVLRGEPTVEPGGISKGWYGVSWAELGAWGLVALVATALVTPSLINKRPKASASEGASFSPLLMWLGVNLLFLAASARDGLGPATWVIAFEIVIIAALLAQRCLHRRR